MGTFYLDAEIENVRNPKKSVTVQRLLVDSGAECTWIHGGILKSIGVKVEKEDAPFAIANGQMITRPIGFAIVRSQGCETVDQVVFAEPGDLQLLGLRTLNGFGALVDARKKRLVAAGPYPAAQSMRRVR